MQNDKYVQCFSMGSNNIEGNCTARTGSVTSMCQPFL